MHGFLTFIRHISAFLMSLETSLTLYKSLAIFPPQKAQEFPVNYLPGAKMVSVQTTTGADVSENAVSIRASVEKNLPNVPVIIQGYK